MDDCIFTSNRLLDKDGYPKAKFQGRLQGVHRIMYRLVNGDDSIPDGGVIGHTCNNKGCVNPRHHYLTTHKENSSHAARDGLYRVGEASGVSTISDAQVLEIIKLYETGDYTQDFLAKMFGCSQSTISTYVKGNRRSRLGGFIIGDER